VLSQESEQRLFVRSDQWQESLVGRTFAVRFLEYTCLRDSCIPGSEPGQLGLEEPGYILLALVVPHNRSGGNHSEEVVVDIRYHSADNDELVNTKQDKTTKQINEHIRN
jgi:hypothetical protein